MPTATPPAVHPKYIVSPGVPADDLADIKAGIELGRAYLTTNLGGDLPPSVVSTLEVTIALTGGGPGGTCCWASGTFMFFDVQNEGFVNTPAYLDHSSTRKKVGTHEYIHVWQYNKGCIDGSRGWITEGVAEWVAHEPQIAAGKVTREAERSFFREAVIQSGQTTLTNLTIWPGHIGYLALDQLMTGKQPSVIAEFCKKMQAHFGVELAFQDAFGTSLAGFEASFKVEAPPPAISGKLSSNSGTIPAGAFVNACPTVGGWCTGGPGRTKPDGSFAIELSPGTYWLNVNVPGQDGPLGWYKAGALLVPDQSAGATVIDTQPGPVTGIVFRIP